MMERRGFLKTLVGGVAVAAAAQTFPFRVYSFPTSPEIVPSFNPEIGGWWSYRYHTKANLPPDTGYRIRYIECVMPTENGEPIPRKSYQTYVFGKDAAWI